MSSPSNPPPLPPPPPSASSVDLENPTPDLKQPRSATKDFGFLPIPSRLRWDPENPPEFTLLLNAIFGFASTFTVASLYYPQSILVTMAKDFDVTYDEVTNIPTLLQASYAVGLVFICPLGDLVPRRALLLLLVLSSALLTLACALVHSIVPFEALSFLLGLVTVTPQVLLPLAGDLAKPHQRAAALSIVLSGLLLGILLARVLAGVIALKGTVSDVYWMSFGLQCLILILLFFTVPNYPRKNKDLTYYKILRSMVIFAVTEPVLVQSCIIGCLSSACFTCFWTTSTFLLDEVYGYNSLQIGLFALIGVVGVLTAPFIGKLVDRLVPWLGVCIALFFILLSQALYTAAAGLSIGALVVVIFMLDVSLQLQQVSNSTRIFALNAAGRARLSAVFIFSVFVGQLVGTAVGTRIYLSGGYRASGAFCMAIVATNLMVLLLRGPHVPKGKWLGWEGGWELRKSVVDRRQAETVGPDEGAVKGQALDEEGGKVDVADQGVAALGRSSGPGQGSKDL